MLVPIIPLEAVSTGRRIISTVLKFSKLVCWVSSFMVPLLVRSKWMYLQNQLQYKPDIMDAMGLLKVYPYIRLYLYIRLRLFLLPFQLNIKWYILTKVLLHCKISMLLVLYQTHSFSLCPICALSSILLTPSNLCMVWWQAILMKRRRNRLETKQYLPK